MRLIRGCNLYPSIYGNGKEFNDMSDLPFHNISKKEMYNAMKLNIVTPHLYSKNNYFLLI